MQDALAVFRPRGRRLRIRAAVLVGRFRRRRGDLARAPGAGAGAGLRLRRRALARRGLAGDLRHDPPRRRRGTLRRRRGLERDAHAPPSSLVRAQVRVHRGNQRQKKLVRVVLPMLREVLRALPPPRVQKRARDDRLAAAAVRLADEAVELAREAVLVLRARCGSPSLGAFSPARVSVVPVPQEKPADVRRSHDRLHDRAQEARVP
mmetsp:Transcript_9379/g.34119  ORF Transcript_9379/g.34119 Transcript_9379/m.34119 type:complete len:206 (-) Transcript_9379:695-1312(-)